MTNYSSEIKMNNSHNKTIKSLRISVSMVVIATLAILAIGLTATNVNAQPSNMTKFTDSQGRFSILIPTTWNTTGQPDRFSSTLLNTADGYGTGMILGQLSTVQDAQIYAVLAVNNVPYGYSLFQPVECVKYKVDGQKVCSYIEVKQADTSINQAGGVVMQMITNINGTLYNITFAGPEDSFDSMLPTFDAMIHSLHFTSVGANSTIGEHK